MGPIPRRILFGLSVLCLIVFMGGPLYAGCSPYIGIATINEIDVHNQSGNSGPYFVEVKALDSSILSTNPPLWQNWTLDICSDQGNRASLPCQRDIAINGGVLQGNWLVIDQDIIQWDYLDLNSGNKHGMEILFKDENGDIVDYLSVDNYSVDGPGGCTFSYDTSYVGGNNFNIQRQPDGLGDWDTTGSGNSGDETENNTNDPVPPGSPELSVADTSTVAGKSMVFTVSLSTAISEDVTISYSTTDGSAVSGVDYTATSGSVTILAGSTTVTVSVSTLVVGTPDSHFFLTLNSVTTGNAIILNNLARGEILTRDVVDHYRFYHDGSGLTCSPEDIQVKACLDAACSAEYAGSISATLGPTGWVGSDSQSFTSSDTLQLWNTTVGTAGLQISGNSSEFVASNATRCFIGATEQADCTMQFYDSGFVFDVPDHVADTLQTVTLSAVRKDLITDQCVPGFQNVTRDIEFWSNYLDPLTGTLAVNVAGSVVVGSSPGTTRSLSFDSAGEATFTLQYADVGQLSLTANYQGSGNDAGLVMTGVDNFIARPDHFYLTIPGNPAAVDAAGAIFKKAGETFKVEVEARNVSDAVTPNYGIESIGESVALVNSLIAPAGETNPVLAGSFDPFGTDCNGNPAPGVACGDFSWNEVGIISLMPSVLDGNYLGSGNVTGNTTGNVGRFIPARLSVSSNSPMFNHGCTLGGFTYLGQEFSFLIDPNLTISALGSGGTVLNNYGNAFWKLSKDLPGRSYSNASAVSATLSVTTLGSTTITGDDNYDGVGIISVAGDKLTFTKPASPIVPFTGLGNLDLLSTDLIDTDGACYDPDVDGTCDPYQLASIGSTELRYGRALLQNAYGPETLIAIVPFTAEYFTTSGYVPNAQDVCTSYNGVNLLFSNYQGNLMSGDTTPSGSGVFITGLGNMFLSAPGVGHDGSVDLTYDLDVDGLGWLKENGLNPKGKATFGIYKGSNRLIYMRESVD